MDNPKTLNITGLDHAELLAALYNNARPAGIGAFSSTIEPLTKDDAEKILRHHDIGGVVHVDYVRGCPIKVCFEGNKLAFIRLYDRDHGQGECARVVNELRESSR